MSRIPTMKTKLLKEIEANMNEIKAILAAEGTEYLTKLPKLGEIPRDSYLVHSHVRTAGRVGVPGSRLWYQKKLSAKAANLEPCYCGWQPRLGPHYRVKLLAQPRVSAVSAS